MGIIMIMIMLTIRIVNMSQIMSLKAFSISIVRDAPTVTNCLLLMLPLILASSNFNPNTNIVIKMVKSVMAMVTPTLVKNIRLEIVMRIVTAIVIVPHTVTNIIMGMVTITAMETVTTIPTTTTRNKSTRTSSLSA